MPITGKEMARMNRIYPAVFHKENEGYWVEFPDIPGCLTQGNTIEQAFAMAKEALALALDGEKCKAPTSLEEIHSVYPGDYVMLVEADEDKGIEHFNNPEIPARIDEGLKKKGYTKYQVAQVLGTNRAYITRIAKGERVPSVDMAKRIGILLGFDWRLFYQRKGS